MQKGKMSPHTQNIMYKDKDAKHNERHFTFTHLADAFIQSDLQCIQAIHFLFIFYQYVYSATDSATDVISLNVYSENITHAAHDTTASSLKLCITPFSSCYALLCEIYHTKQVEPVFLACQTPCLSWHCCEIMCGNTL